jgi:hypothetical protein
MAIFTSLHPFLLNLTIFLAICDIDFSLFNLNDNTYLIDLGGPVVSLASLCEITLHPNNFLAKNSHKKQNFGLNSVTLNMELAICVFIWYQIEAGAQPNRN